MKLMIWNELEKDIEEYDKRKPKKISYPKGSIQEAVQQALKELGGNNVKD